MTVLDLLCKRLPKAFVTDEAKRRPLKRGIHRDIMARLSVDADALSRALASYVSSPHYRARLIEGADRIDLDGKPYGVVTAGEAAQAGNVSAPSPPQDSKAQVRRLSLADLKEAARQRRSAP